MKKKYHDSKFSSLDKKQMKHLTIIHFQLLITGLIDSKMLWA